jgi:hypothetical protein
MSVLHPRPQRRTTYLPVSPLHQASAHGLTDRLVDPASAESVTARTTAAAVRGLAASVLTSATLRLPKRSTL